jgi:hypothetical protein
LPEVWVVWASAAAETNNSKERVKMAFFIV